MSDRKFRAWVETLESCLDDNFGQYIHGEGRNFACHVRRSANAGTAYKPQFSCVPMTREQHDYQHLHGELACILRYLNPASTTGGNFIAMNGDDEEAAKDWFDRQAATYLRRWNLVIAHKLKYKARAA